MATMNISLSESMKSWVDERSRTQRYGNPGDYVCDLIRRDQERAAKMAHIQAMIDEALASKEGQRTPEEIESAALTRLAELK